jgi:hypothetical protein
MADCWRMSSHEMLAAARVIPVASHSNGEGGATHRCWLRSGGVGSSQGQEAVVDDGSQEYWPLEAPTVQRDSDYIVGDAVPLRPSRKAAIPSRS